MRIKPPGASAPRPGRQAAGSCTGRAAGAPQRARAAPSDDELFQGLPSLDQLEKRYLRHVLEATRGNRSRAADILGIDPRTLHRMAERFGLDLSEIEPGGEPPWD